MTTKEEESEPELEQEQENESQNNDDNIANLIFEEAPKKKKTKKTTKVKAKEKKDNNESNDSIGNNDDNDNYDNNDYNDNNNVPLIVETSPKKKRRMDDDNDNSIKLSPEKNTKKSTKRMKEEIKIKGIRRSKKSTIEGKEIILSNNDFIKYKEKDNEKKAINNNKESYYRIEKLPKEDKGKKGGKNLFLNDSLKGSKKNKNNEYLETENTTTDTSLEKEKNVTEFLQRAQTIKYKGYN